jgi:hypothetical protein
MPARSYRVTVENHSDFDIVLKEAHLCRGDWTPGGWEPPPTIASKGEGSWQSESGNPFEGTEGWVKYFIQSDAQPISDAQIYVHWQVPYLGTPVIPGWDASSAQVSAGGDVVPHCDASDGSGGSSFGGWSTVHEFKLAAVSFSDQTQPTVGDVLATYSNPASVVAGFLYGFNDHMHITLRLSKIGSVRQAIPRGYDPSKGLRALAGMGNMSSVRKLLALP